MQIRRGILLAKHDYKVHCFRVKHATTDDEIIHDWLDVYAAARKVITAGKATSPLTAQAYYRTMESLRKQDCP